MRSLCALLVPLVAAACGAGWRRSDLPLGTLKPRQQIQLWRTGVPTRWHALVIGSDSLSAIPFMRPITCDSCRVTMPRADVDSIRLGNPVGGFWKTAGLIFVTPFAILLGACIANGSWPRCFLIDAT